jgi:ankyrin repeat protein
MSKITDLHNAVKRGDLAEMKDLLETDRSLADARSDTDVRGTYPLHVAAEFGQARAAQLLLNYGMLSYWIPKMTRSRLDGRRSSVVRKS